MIVHRYNPKTEAFEPMPGGDRLFSSFGAPPVNASQQDFQRKLRSAGFGQLRHVEPSFRKTLHRFASGVNDIYSGYAVNPPPEPVSGYQNTVSWINGVWNVPNIRTPLWLTRLMAQYPVQTGAVLNGDVPLAPLAGNPMTWTTEEVNVYNVLQLALTTGGFSCASWVGIQDVTGNLVQAGVSSFIPSVTNPFDISVPAWMNLIGGPALWIPEEVDLNSLVPVSATQRETDGFVAEYFAFFEYDPSVSPSFALPLQVGPGDTVHVLIQMLGPQENVVDPSVLGAIPQESANTAVVYFGNVSRDWYTAFVVSTDALHGTPGLLSERTAFWVIEQESKPYLIEFQTSPVTETPGTGLGPLDTPATAGGPQPDFVMPLARHGTVFFTNAVCGQWLSSPYAEEPIGGLFVDSGAAPPASITATVLYDDVASDRSAFAAAPKYALVYPSEDLSVQPHSQNVFMPGPIVMTDALWNFARFPPAPMPPSTAPTLPNPPLGPARQYGLPFNGTAMSAGQLVAEDIVMCKYVYPGG